MFTSTVSMNKILCAVPNLQEKNIVLEHNFPFLNSIKIPLN